MTDDPGHKVVVGVLVGLLLLAAVICIAGLACLVLGIEPPAVPDGGLDDVGWLL